MTRRILALLAVAVLLVSLLAACKKDDGIVDQEEAVQIVLDEIGLTEEQANPHVHPTTVEERVCWGVYVTVKGKNMLYVVDSTTGEILSAEESTHKH